MLQAALCGVCILSAALLYQDYVTVPRKNRELVEALKTCFPEELPPGGGSLGQKEEQAGRETEVSAFDLRSLQSRAARKNRSIICGEITGETTTSMEVCSSRQTAFWENRGS